MTGFRLKLASAAILIAILGLTLALFPVRASLAGMLTWVQDQGYWAPAVLVVTYLLTSLVFLPSFVLSIGAGFLFGPVLGTVTASIGSALGATTSFLVGRYLAREWIQAMIAGNARFTALNRAVGREGFKIVMLARLSPILPGNVLNFTLALTTVRIRDFALASWIGMFPLTMVYVYLGSTLADLAELESASLASSNAHLLLSTLGLAATLVIFVLLTRAARRSLAEASGQRAAVESDAMD